MNYTRLGLLRSDTRFGDLCVYSPVNGAEIGRVHTASMEVVENAISSSEAAFKAWRSVPAPRRGELIRQFGQALRDHKEPLGELISIESGKILQEGLGEVQEMIDICDFAVGLSRQLYGLTIASERPGHRMMEVWHPLGPVAVISAFNFPAAVWAWNFALAIVCGNPVLWKPSEKTPITALACQRIWESVADGFGEAPNGLMTVLNGERNIGEALVNDPRIPLVSATGSCAMGKQIAPIVASRMGRCLLELGGNNGMIVAPSADLDLAVRAILFSAVGTAGQRCTSLRRLIVHEDIYDELINSLKIAYVGINVGSPLEEATLVGPLIDEASYRGMQRAMTWACDAGGILTGGYRVGSTDAFYVRPAIVEMPSQSAIVMEETFAPILYVMKYTELSEAIEMHNAVEQGLSSCIFTTDVREAELFMSSEGSDCGITNVNIGPSGAEIGGAFGGEKSTGGGREAGSDSWKNYMRRATNTINYSNDLPLAQGVEFN